MRSGWSTDFKHPHGSTVKHRRRGIAQAISDFQALHLPAYQRGDKKAKKREMGRRIRNRPVSVMEEWGSFHFHLLTTRVVSLAIATRCVKPLNRVICKITTIHLRLRTPLSRPPSPSNSSMNASPSYLRAWVPPTKRAYAQVSQGKEFGRIQCMQASTLRVLYHREKVGDAPQDVWVRDHIWKAARMRAAEVVRVLA